MLHCTISSSGLVLLLLSAMNTVVIHVSYMLHVNNENSAKIHYDCATKGLPGINLVALCYFIFMLVKTVKCVLL